MFLRFIAIDEHGLGYGPESEEINAAEVRER